jgi:diacylglycerol kinase (ATP)
VEPIHLLRSPVRGAVSPQTGAQALLEAYEDAGHSVVDLTGPTAEATSASLGAAVARNEVRRLVVAGGDGLVHLAIQHLAGTAIPLGIAPAGTGNDFAAALGIDTVDVTGTLRDETAIDLIQVELADGSTTWAATVVIAGFPADINARANSMTLPLGSALYTLAALLELPRFHRRVVDLEVDGTAITSDTAMLAMGNTRFFGGGMLVCPDATGTDGLLHLTSIEGVGRLGVLRHLAQKSGGSANRPEVNRLNARSITITTPGIELWADGEPLGSSPATVAIVPGALHVAGVDPAALHPAPSD